VDIPSESVLLVLDGFVDPWNPPGTARRRFSLVYQGATTVESAGGDVGWVSEHLDNSDLGYHEIELMADGTFEHRMLFASGIELVVRFRELQLNCERLPDAEPDAAPNGGPATLPGDSGVTERPPSLS